MAEHPLVEYEQFDWKAAISDELSDLDIDACQKLAYAFALANQHWQEPDYLSKNPLQALGLPFQAYPFIEDYCQGLQALSSLLTELNTVPCNNARVAELLETIPKHFIKHYIPGPQNHRKTLLHVLFSIVEPSNAAAIMETAALLINKGVPLNAFDESGQCVFEMLARMHGAVDEQQANFFIRNQGHLLLNEEKWLQFSPEWIHYLGQNHPELMQHTPFLLAYIETRKKNDIYLLQLAQEHVNNPTVLMKIMQVISLSRVSIQSLGSLLIANKQEPLYAVYLDRLSNEGKVFALNCVLELKGYDDDVTQCLDRIFNYLQCHQDELSFTPYQQIELLNKLMQRPEFLEKMINIWLLSPIRIDALVLTKMIGLLDCIEDFKIIQLIIERCKSFNNGLLQSCIEKMLNKGAEGESILLQMMKNTSLVDTSFLSVLIPMLPCTPIWVGELVQNPLFMKSQALVELYLNKETNPVHRNWILISLLKQKTINPEIMSLLKNHSKENTEFFQTILLCKLDFNWTSDELTDLFHYFKRVGHLPDINYAACLEAIILHPAATSEFRMEVLLRGCSKLKPAIKISFLLDQIIHLKTHYNKQDWESFVVCLLKKLDSDGLKRFSQEILISNKVALSNNLLNALLDFSHGDLEIVQLFVTRHLNRLNSAQFDKVVQYLTSDNAGPINQLAICYNTIIRSELNNNQLEALTNRLLKLLNLDEFQPFYRGREGLKSKPWHLFRPDTLEKMLPRFGGAFLNSNPTF